MQQQQTYIKPRQCPSGRWWQRGFLTFPLLYIGDGQRRENVTLVYDGLDARVERVYGTGFTGRQWFCWPDGSVHLVPVYTVVEDTPSVRRGFDLPLRDFPLKPIRGSSQAPE